MQITIRKAKKGDAKGFVNFWNEGFRRGHFKYTGAMLRGKEDIKKFEGVYSKNKNNQFTFFAIDSKTGKIVGVCSFVAKEKGRTRHMGESAFATHPDYSRKGIGTKLLRTVLNEAKKRGFKRIEIEAALDNIASIRLARKFGFEIEGKKKAGFILDNGKYVDTYILGKILK